eukprot:scaffold285_cov330-Pavlova_lutheri.AAC.2
MLDGWLRRSVRNEMRPPGVRPPRLPLESIDRSPPSFCILLVPIGVQCTCIQGSSHSLGERAVHPGTISTVRVAEPRAWRGNGSPGVRASRYVGQIFDSDRTIAFATTTSRWAPSRIPASKKATTVWCGQTHAGVGVGIGSGSTDRIRSPAPRVRHLGRRRRVPGVALCVLGLESTPEGGAGRPTEHGIAPSQSVPKAGRGRGDVEALARDPRAPVARRWREEDGRAGRGRSSDRSCPGVRRRDVRRSSLRRVRFHHGVGMPLGIAREEAGVHARPLQDDRCVSQTVLLLGTCASRRRGRGHPA